MKTVKHLESLIVWGSFSSINGRGVCIFLPKNVTMMGDKYIEVLRDHLLPFMQIHGCHTFMHNSAPPHKILRRLQFLFENTIDVLDWPGNSPDLNPNANA